MIITTWWGDFHSLEAFSPKSKQNMLAMMPAAWKWKWWWWRYIDSDVDGDDNDDDDDGGGGQRLAEHEGNDANSMKYDYEVKYSSPPWPGSEKVVRVIQHDRLKVGDQVHLESFNLRSKLLRLWRQGVGLMMFSNKFRAWSHIKSRTQKYFWTQSYNCASWSHLGLRAR